MFQEGPGVFNCVIFFIAVQHERGPRNSTLRRQQLAFFYNDGRLPNNSSVLDLAMVKSLEASPTRLELSPHITAAPFMLSPPMPAARVSVYYQTLFANYSLYDVTNGFLFFTVSFAANGYATISFIASD